MMPDVLYDTVRNPLITLIALSLVRDFAFLMYVLFYNAGPHMLDAFICVA